MNSYKIHKTFVFVHLAIFAEAAHPMRLDSLPDEIRG